MFDNDFHLLLNTTNILMHVSLGIISSLPNISCAVFDGLESLKIHLRCSTLLTVATIVWQRRN